MPAVVAWLRCRPTELVAVRQVRWGDGEVVSEATYSFTNLLGMYNDHLLCTRDDEGTETETSKGGPNQPAVSRCANWRAPEQLPSHLRLTAAWVHGYFAAVFWRVRGSSVTHGLRWCLTVLQSVQVVTEMLAYRRGGKNAKWNLVRIQSGHTSVTSGLTWVSCAQIVFIELLRAVLKAAILFRSRGPSVLLNGGRVIPPKPPAEAVAEPGAETATPDEAEALLAMLGGGDEPAGVPTKPQRWWKGARSGLKVPLPQDLPSDLDPKSADGADSSWLLAGEVLNIVRPVVYVVARCAPRWGM